MRTLIAVLAVISAAGTAKAQDGFTPPGGRFALPGASPAVCPTCGHLLRQVAALDRNTGDTLGDIAADLEAAAAAGGTGSATAAVVARTVRIIEADAATGYTLHESGDPAFRDYPSGRAPYERVADVLISDVVTAGLPNDITKSYARLGTILLDDRVTLSLGKPSYAGEWSSQTELLRVLGAIRDKYASGFARARRDRQAAAKNARIPPPPTLGRFSLPGRQR